MGSKILNVPYKCQNDPDANQKRTDCGPCCVAMILGGIGQQVTTNAVTTAANMQGDSGLTQSQVVSAAAAFGLNMAWSQGFTLDDLKKFIDNGQPPIALVKYANLPDRVDKGSTGGHYVVVVGYDDAAQNILINDPDMFPWAHAAGFQKAYSYNTWMSAWGGFAVGENWNFSLIYPTNTGLIGGASSGTPAPASPPAASPTGDVFVTTANGLNLRAQASASAASLGGVVFGQHLTALGNESAADAQGITWQQVKTDAGVIAFVAASQAGERFIASNKGADPYVVQVIDNQQIRDAGGLALRPARDITQNPIDRAQAGERLTVFQRVVETDGTPWLWAQSARNQIGWARETSQGQVLVTKVTQDLSGSGTGATPEPQRNTPTPTATSQTVYVSTTDGLNLRKDQNSTSQVIVIVPYGTKLTTIGPTVGPDAKGITWQQVQTDQNQLGWVAVQIGTDSMVSTSAPAPAQAASAVPWGKCLAGLGMGNPQPLTAGQLMLIGSAKLEAFKVLTLGDPSQNQQLIAQLKQIRSDMFIVARLFFSVNVGSKFTAQNFVDFCMNGLTAYYQAGVRYFEIHNEPNLDTEGMNWNWASGADFGSWLQQVLNIVKPQFPDAKWGYPGLSPQPNVDAFLDGSAAAANACDWIGVHCYWQQPPHQPPFPMDGDNAGYYWRAKFKPRFPNQLLLITEFSNNSASVSPNDKGTQYADYIKLLRNEPNVGAAFGFALNWPGQDSNHEGWDGTGIPTSFLARAGATGALA